MSVIAFRGGNPGSEARALLNRVLKEGDIVGADDTGRTALLLMIDPWTLDRLLAFDADAADLEDADGEPEPDDETDGPATVLDFVPPKRIERPSRIASALAFALLLMTAVPGESHADEGPVVAPLPMSTAQAPQQCCRICRKGQPCGDGCISAAKQCRKEQGCACSAAGDS
jgi:hypothetical protein